MTPPSSNLINNLAAFLIPLFHNGSTTNPANARDAAREILAAFRCRDPWELLLGVQAVSATMAALGSNALSATEGLSLSMILRLRGNANACGRTAETSRRALSAARAETDTAGLLAAEQARDAAFHARYTDEQVRAEVAETQRMADTAEQARRNRQANTELAEALEEFTASCQRRVAAEQEQAARTGIAVVLPPLAPLDPAIELISFEDFLNAPPGFSLIDTTPRPRPAAPAEAATPGDAIPGAAATPGSAPAASPAQTAPDPDPAPAQPAPPARKLATPPPTNPTQPNATNPHPKPTIHHPQPQTDDEARRSAWANAMLQVAAEFNDELPHASPTESRINKLRVNALSSVARTLLAGPQPTTEPYFAWPPEPDAPPPGA